uniref:Uncharacterized protein n=1 Tax=Arundo donax TaxID=35708 RepID=A0A0A9GQM0_ARUDO
MFYHYSGVPLSETIFCSCHVVIDGIGVPNAPAVESPSPFATECP